MEQAKAGIRGANLTYSQIAASVLKRIDSGEEYKDLFPTSAVKFNILNSLKEKLFITESCEITGVGKVYLRGGEPITSCDFINCVRECLGYGPLLEEHGMVRGEKSK